MCFANKMGRNATCSISCFPQLDVCLLYICPPLKRAEVTHSYGCNIMVCFRNIFPHILDIFCLLHRSAQIYDSTSRRYMQPPNSLPSRPDEFASNIHNHRGLAAAGGLGTQMLLSVWLHMYSCTFYHRCKSPPQRATIDCLLTELPDF